MTSEYTGQGDNYRGWLSKCTNGLSQQEAKISTTLEEGALYLFATQILAKIYRIPTTLQVNRKGLIYLTFGHCFTMWCFDFH